MDNRDYSIVDWVADQCIKIQSESFPADVKEAILLELKEMHDHLSLTYPETPGWVCSGFQKLDKTNQWYRIRVGIINPEYTHVIYLLGIYAVTADYNIITNQTCIYETRRQLC